MKQKLILLMLLNLSMLGAQTNFNFNWKFMKGEHADAHTRDFNDDNWRTLDLPHDWSIEDLAYKSNSEGRVVSGPFDSEAIAGKHTGFTVGGVGWYRKHFSTPLSDTNKIVYINFDEIYMNSNIWINGHYLAKQPYGYTANWYNLTPYLKYGDTENVIAVEVNNTGLNSRWYAGSGIYRDVTLLIVDKIHIKPWGVFIKSTKADSNHAKICIELNLVNTFSEMKDVHLELKILNSKSRVISSKQITTTIHHQVPSRTKVYFTIDNPELWSPHNPELYKVVSMVQYNNSVVNKTETQFGIRSIEFDPERGMLLNGKSLKLKGGALHANNGPLGACAYYRAEKRRVELLKNLGFNAIRCGHNPPSQSFLNACDKLGVLVINETFDVWSEGALPNDYHKYFNKWWKHDVKNMVLRDRNHPSVFAWSIRNQVGEAKDSLAVAMGREMADFIRMLDPTRPVTANVTMFEDWGDGDPELWKLRDPFIENLDICGYSYQSSQFENVHKRLPGRIQYSSEIDPLNAFRNWMRVTDNDYVIGNFTWTAQDFMGEVGLGWNARKSFRAPDSLMWPWNVTYSGDIDICGFRRPRSYYRNILFNHGKQLSAFVYAPKSSFDGNNNSRWGWADVKPSWTWPGFEGDTLNVEVYSSYPKVELFINNLSLGINQVGRNTDFKANWLCPYKSGTLRAVAYSIDGVKQESWELKTAAEPYKIRLTPDRNILVANRQDLCYINVEILDKDNNLVPYAHNLLEFDISGKGVLAAVGNGNPISTESFQQPYRNAYEGKCLLIIKTTDEVGDISIEAKSKGLKSDNIKLSTTTTKK